MTPSDFLPNQRVRFTCKSGTYTGRVISTTNGEVRVAADDGPHWPSSLCTFDEEEIVAYRLEAL